MQNYGTLETFFFGLELFAIWMTIGCWIFSDILLNSKEAKIMPQLLVRASQLPTPSPVAVELQTVKEAINPPLTLVEANTDKPSIKTINSSNHNEL
ncbi:MAG: hypothetical protein AAGA18_13915 [Verrucomicrobiota bacterium]